MRKSDEMEVSEELRPLYNNLKIIKNMIVNTSQTDVSLLVVRSSVGGYEEIFSKNMTINRAALESCHPAIKLLLTEDLSLKIVPR